MNLSLILAYIEGTNTEITDKEGNTALHYLCRHFSDETSKVLDLFDKCLENSTGHYLLKTINAQNSLGQTPLHLATANNNPVLIQALIDRGADLEIADNEEKSALCLAAQCNSWEGCKILLENGANEYMVTSGSEFLEKVKESGERGRSRGGSTRAKRNRTHSYAALTDSLPHHELLNLSLRFTDHDMDDIFLFLDTLS